MEVVALENTNVDLVSDKVQDLFSKEGYTLLEGTKIKGVYGKGSRAMRFIAGGFSNYNKFGIEIVSETPLTKVHLNKAMSGMSGGAIGATRLDKEFDRIQALILLLK